MAIRPVPFFAPLHILILFLVLVAGQSPVDVDVGVVLDLYSPFGKACSSSISMAVDDFYSAHPNYTTRLRLQTRDSNRTTLGAASAALDLISNVGVSAILGPQGSAQAAFLADLGAAANVPIISFTATSPSLSGRPFFVRPALNDSSQLPALSAVVAAFLWRNVVLVYEDSEFGSGVIPYLIDALRDVGARVSSRCVVRPTATASEVAEQLRQLIEAPTRVFLVHMSPETGTTVFSEAAKLGMMGEGYVWLMTDGLTMELESTRLMGDVFLEGAVGLRPVLPLPSKVFDNFTARWKLRFQKDHPDIKKVDINVFDLWAYDTVWGLCMAIEKVALADSGAAFRLGQKRSRSSSKGSTNLTSLDVSPVGPKLLETILATDFNGWSGRFQLMDGQLQVVAFELVNVVEKRAKTIGYWTPALSISRYMDREAPHGEIIWSGKVNNPPKGWEWPVKGKKLKVLVPKSSMGEPFVKLEFDRRTNTNVGDGFCIKVFQAALAKMPYNIPIEYTLYVDKDGNSDGSYDELIYQVYLKKYDAVVGDTTIWYNRSIYVDFTTPYTESGVVMLVSTKEEPYTNKLWSFLEPMTHQLWLASGAAFLFTGFILWVLEHRVNDAFRGTPRHQLGTVLYMSFSTLIFAHRERMSSNLSRVVVIVWVFVVLILTSSYTASLSSMLTAQQFSPTITDVNDLIRRGENVGYLANSFVRSLLVNLGFNESKITPYGSSEEYLVALSKGTLNGGVAAIFDEIPYVRFAKLKYPSKFTVVGPVYKTDGFGYVFPKGSPLVADVSKAILTVKEGSDFIKLEKNLYGDMAYAPLVDSGSQRGLSPTNRLSFRRFLGLFLITGVTSTVALLLHIVLVFYDQRHTLDSENESENLSFWQKCVTFAKALDQKDLSSPTFSEWVANPAAEVTEASSPPFTPRSPSAYSHNPLSELDAEEEGPVSHYTEDRQSAYITEETVS